LSGAKKINESEFLIDLLK